MGIKGLLQYSSVTDMFSNLGWQSLENRHIDARLTMFYKIIYGLVAIPLPSYFVRPEVYTRHMHSHTDKFIHQSVITSIHFSPCWLFFGTSYQLISSLFLIVTLSKQESVRSNMYILKSYTVFNLLLTPISLTPNSFIFIQSHYHPFIYSSLLLIFLTNTPCAHYIQIILERGFWIIKR